MYQAFEEWNRVAPPPAPQDDVIACKTRGYEYLKFLSAKLNQNPDLLADCTTTDIRKILISSNRCDLDQSPDIRFNLLPKLYAAYDVKSNHAFRAWDMNKRVQLMRAVQEIPDLDTNLNNNRFNTLIILHQLHARIYGFAPDFIQTTIKPPVNGLISHGSRCRLMEIITVNTYEATPRHKSAKFHWDDISEIAGLIFHEGRHTHQTKMSANEELMQDPEYRDVADIMDISSYRHFYLNGGNNDLYMLNPSEKDAYDFQRDMENFIKASPDMRKTLIFEMEQRRDAHLSMSASPNTQTHLPQLIAA